MTYVLRTRNASKVGKVENARFIRATVDGVCGIILFPDYFKWPDSIRTPKNINETPGAYSDNKYSVQQFKTLEDLGVVFLPAAGSRRQGTLKCDGVSGFYWTGDYDTPSTADAVEFSEGTVATQNIFRRSDGHAVRLVINED